MPKELLCLPIDSAAGGVFGKHSQGILVFAFKSDLCKHTFWGTVAKLHNTYRIEVARDGLQE